MMCVAILAGLIMSVLVTPAGAVSIIPVTEDKWTCYDYSVNFAKENPEWGIVSMSTNMWFKGTSHMVNYKIIDGGDSLLIHDGLYRTEYEIYNFRYAGYYHFCFKNETPVRYYRVMRDNSGMV
jgi:hypothetical protein